VKTFDVAARRAILGRSQLFQGMTPVELDGAVARAVLRRIPRGEFILHQGAPSTGVFMIAAGRVRVSLVAEDGKEITLGVLGPGEALGEMSLLDGEGCSASASAQEECVLLVIERAQFGRVLRDNPDFCLRLLAMLSGRLRQSNTARLDMARFDLPTRLGRVLLRLARDYGDKCAAGTRIALRLSQKDISSLVGASREKVNKQLRRWEQDGILGRDGGWMVIVRSEALAQLG